jgi:Zn-dependent M28 family amino/carboxypeptidase
MKTVLSIINIFICLSSQSQSTLIDSIITKSSLEHTISALANDSMKGRFTAKPETNNAAVFIASRFESAGLNMLEGNNKFFSYYPIILKENGNTTLVKAINVLGAIKGMESPDTIVIFCAHYDHIGVKQALFKDGKDSIYNGANDNASGVALLIELAKYYVAVKSNRYTLVFIAFSGEELGLLGSTYTAANMDQSFVHAVINFDMVGRPLNKGAKSCMVVVEYGKPLKPIIKKLNDQAYSRKRFFISDQFPLENFFARSDQYSFKNVKNRLFFTTSSADDKYYHTVDDEIETIDFEFLLLTTKNIAAACKTFLK